MEVYGKKQQRVWTLVLMLAASVSVILAFYSFINNNGERAEEISKDYLQDAALQNERRIDDALERAYEEIRIAANLYATMYDDENISYQDLVELSENLAFDKVEYVDAQGVCHTVEGTAFEVKDRDYYIDGMGGNSGFNVIFDSKMTDGNLVVFYSPIMREGKAAGLILGMYTVEQLQSLLHSSFFETASTTYLCTPNGSIVACYNENIDTITDIFDERCFNGGLDSETKEELKNALSLQQEYEFQYEGSSGRGNAYVLPLDNSDMLLVQTFPSAVTADIVTNANNAGITLLAKLMVIFAFCLLIVIIMDFMQKKKLIRENSDKSYIVNGLTHLYGIFVLLDLEKGMYRYLAGTRPRSKEVSTQGSIEELLKYVLTLARDEDDKRYLEHELAPTTMKKRLSDRKIPYRRYEFRINSEEEHWDSVGLICLDKKDGIPTEVLLTHQDVTAQKKREMRGYEAMKSAYMAAENANQAKSTFLSNMSHDIRTPLNAIIGLSTIATMNIDDTGRVGDCLTKINSSGQHLLSLINEVLDVSKIESGKMILSEEGFDICSVVKEIEDIFTAQTRQKNQEFIVDVGEIEHKKLIGDSMRLKQIMVNILGNAVKFTPDHGRIRFEIFEEKSETPGFGRFTFVCEDNGMGMEEDFIRKMYEPFSREEKAVSENIEGTGLGMSIVKSMVQIMNGTIKVDSKKNVGSTFNVTVFIKIDENGAGRSESGSTRGIDELKSRNYSGRRVLVAEDNEINMEIAGELLKSVGLEVENAANGRYAVEKVTAAEPGYYDLIFMDIQMPLMNGYEATEAIRAQEREDLKTIPIVAMSADAFNDDVTRAIKSGMNGHVSKPVKIQKLLEALDKWL